MVKFFRAIGAGFAAGFISAILANIIHQIFLILQNTSYPELTIITISFISIITSVLGSLVYYAACRWTNKGYKIFIITGVIVLILDEISIIMQSFPLQFHIIANIMHVTVALIAFITIPKIAGKQ